MVPKGAKSRKSMTVLYAEKSAARNTDARYATFCHSAFESPMCCNGGVRLGVRRTIHSYDQSDNCSRFSAGIIALAYLSRKLHPRTYSAESQVHTRDVLRETLIPSCTHRTVVPIIRIGSLFTSRMSGQGSGRKNLSEQSGSSVDRTKVSSSYFVSSLNYTNMRENEIV